MSARVPSAERLPHIRVVALLVDLGHGVAVQPLARSDRVVERVRVVSATAVYVIRVDVLRAGLERGFADLHEVALAEAVQLIGRCLALVRLPGRRVDSRKRWMRSCAEVFESLLFWREAESNIARIKLIFSLLL